MKKIEIGKASAYLYILPALLFFLGFLVYPIIRTIFISMHSWDGISKTMDWVGFLNYQRIIIGDANFRYAFLNNVIWTVLTIVVPMSIGFILAVVIESIHKGKSLVRGLTFFPNILPLVAVGLIWTWIYNPVFGLLNASLEAIGLESLKTAWLGERSTALLSTFVAASWQYIPFCMVIFMSGLQSIPVELYEASRIDGARALQQFRHITVPLMRETTTVVLVLSIIGSFKVFDIIYAMTGGGPNGATETVAIYLYSRAFRWFQMGYASAMAILLTLVIMVITIIQIKFRNRERLEF